MYLCFSDMFVALTSQLRNILLHIIRIDSDNIRTIAVQTEACQALAAGFFVFWSSTPLQFAAISTIQELTSQRIPSSPTHELLALVSCRLAASENVAHLTQHGCGLVQLLVDRLLVETKSTLQGVTSPHTLLVSIEKLLSSLQRSLVVASDYTGLVRYSSVVMPAAANLLHFAVECNVTHLLHSTFIQSVISPFAMWIAVITKIDRPEEIQQLLQHMTELLGALDPIAYAPGKEDDLTYMANANAKHTVTVIAEDSAREQDKPTADMEREKLVHIPGASELLVSFDKECHTEERWSFLRVYRGMGRDSVAQFTGPNVRWPRKPLRISGDTVVFNFLSKTPSNDWAWKATVTAKVYDVSSQLSS